MYVANQHISAVHAADASLKRVRTIRTKRISIREKFDGTFNLVPPLNSYTIFRVLV